MLGEGLGDPGFVVGVSGAISSFFFEKAIASLGFRCQTSIVADLGGAGVAHLRAFVAHLGGSSCSSWGSCC